MSFFFGIISLWAWALGDVLVTFISRRIGYLKAYFWALFFGFLLSSLYLPFAGVPDHWTFFVAIFLGAGANIGALLFYRGLAEGNASLTGALAGSFGIVTVILSVLFFGESIHPFHLAGITLSFLGIILVSVDLKMFLKLRMTKFLADRTIVYGLGAMILWGIYYAFIRIPIEEVGWYWAFYPVNLFFIVPILLNRVDEGFFVPLREKGVMKIIIVYAILGTIASFSYNIGLTQGLTSVVAPIAGASPVLFVLLTRVFFREKLTLQQQFGVAFTLTGILLVGLRAAI